MTLMLNLNWQDELQHKQLSEICVELIFIQRAFQFLKVAVFLWCLEQLYLKIAPHWSEEMIIKSIQLYREHE